MKTIATARAESTCQKRATVCVIYDVDDDILACESNRCAPPNGICVRIGVSNTKADYPVESSCNWTHAEQRAVAALPRGSRPHRALLFGHDFYCDACETALRAAGVVVLEVA